jgi:hypothetical protein
MARISPRNDSHVGSGRRALLLSRMNGPGMIYAESQMFWGRSTVEGSSLYPLWMKGDGDGQEWNEGTHHRA